MAEDEDAKRKQKPATTAATATTATTTAAAATTTTTTKSRIIQLNTSSSRAGKKDIPAGLLQNASLRSSSVQSSASARASGNSNNNNNNNSNSNSSYPDRAQGGGGNRSRPADSGNNSNNTGNSSSSAWRSAPGSSRGGGSGGGRFGGRFYGNSGGRGSGGSGGSFHNSTSNSASGGGGSSGGGSSGGGGGYFKRHGSPSRGHFESSAYHRERTFSRGRGRSMSRSPSRSRTRSRSPRSRTRSRSPRSMSRSPRSRSRSRSRSWSPRGSRSGFSSRDHRDSGWERSSRMSGGSGGQYQDRGGGRGRGMGNFYDRNSSGGGDYYEGRGRSRERDGDHGSAARGSSSWSGGRGGGGGPGSSGGRYSSFGRGSGTSGSGGRFREFPKDQRFSSSSTYGNDSRYGSRRSESRDRVSGDMSNPSGSGGAASSNSSFRDRNFPRDRERDRIESRDGGNPVRNPSYGPDLSRRSNSTASRKNEMSGHGEDRRSDGGDRPGDRKREERDSEQQEREKNRAGPDRDIATSGLGTKAKRDLLLSARTLPPRPSFHFNSTGSAGGSRASTPKESQDVHEDSNDEKSLLSKEALTSKLSAIGETAERDDKKDAEIALVSEDKPDAVEVQEDIVMGEHDAESELKRDIEGEKVCLSADKASEDRETVDSAAVSPDSVDPKANDKPAADDHVPKDEDVVMDSSSDQNDLKVHPKRDVARSESEPVRQSSDEDNKHEDQEAVQSDGIEMADGATVEAMEDVEEKISEAVMPEREDSSISIQLREEGTESEKQEKALSITVSDQPAPSPTADISPVKTASVSEKSSNPIAVSKDESSASIITQSAGLVPSRSEQEADEAKPVEHKEENAQTVSVFASSEKAENKPSPETNVSNLEEGEPTSLVEDVTASDAVEVPVPVEASPKGHAEPRHFQEADNVEPQATSANGKTDTSSDANAGSQVVEKLPIAQGKEQTVQEKSASVSDNEEKFGKLKEKVVVAAVKEEGFEADKKPSTSGASNSILATAQAKQEPESHTLPSSQKILTAGVESKKVELVADQVSSSKMSGITGGSSKIVKQRNEGSSEATQSNAVSAVSISSKKPAAPFERERGGQESGRRLSITEEKGGHASGSPALLPDKNDVKPRASSFSSSNAPNSSVGASQRDGVHYGERGLQRTYSASSNLIHQEKRDGDYRHRAMLSDQKRNSPQKNRPNLERHGSFSSERGERTSPLLSKTRSVPGMSLTGVSSSRLSSTTSYGSPVQVLHDSSSEQRKRARRDEPRSSEAVKPESRIPPSATDSDKLKSIKGPVGRSSPQPTSHSSHALKSTELESPPEELPALPEIPLPSGVLLPPSQLDDPGADFGTPTKQPKRPRLGWGQGLVASSPPPQPPKRPRIGWGEGLMQQAAASSPTSSVVSSSAETAATAPTGNDGGGEGKTEKLDEAMSPVEAVIVEDAKMEELEVIESNEDAQPESQPDESSQPQADAVGSSNVTVKTPESVVEVKEEPTVPTKPSKEEILSSIDELDSTIASVKKHIKLLQSVIKEAESAPDAALTSETSENRGMEPVMADQEVGDGVGDDGKKELDSASDTKEENVDVPVPVSQPPSPVKIAVDPAFIQLVANVFSENARKAITANDNVPKRTFNDEVVTMIYREPSDYPFYQENLDRGMELRDSIRLRVRARNRLRHEHLKKLAREYVDLKKMWKLRVKKMEKDRKRQEKMRTKQQQKLKAKQKSALASGDPSAQAAVPNANQGNATTPQILGSGNISTGSDSAGIGGNNLGIGGIRTSSRLTNNSSADLQSKSELEKLEQAKAQALVDQEIRKKRLKNALTTIVPDMIVTIEERKTRYFLRNGKGQGCMTNGIASDWKKREKAETHVNPWNDLEKCIYIDKFLQYPKNFARISSFLSNKNTGDVIAFYYRTKKVVDYKALLREQQLRRRGTGSKNTWSCWNLSACASICLGVKFPEHIARLLLHPSNFRSHQASDNIINSSGAQLLLRNSAKKDESAITATSSSGITAVAFISAAEGGVPSGSAVSAEVNETKKLAFEEGASERQLLDLYSQKLSQFVTGQQQPFLVNFAEFLSDNSYSTGYEVSTLSVAERLKRYRIPAEPKNVEKIENATEKTSVASNRAAPTDRAQEGGSRVKSQPGATSSSNSAAKNGNGAPSAHLTKKELKQQRKLKKIQEQSASQPPAVAAATAVAAPLSSSGGVSTSGSNQTVPTGRKKPMPPTSTISVAAANRNSPRVIGEEKEKSAPATKKNSRSGNATPGSRRNSSVQNAPSVSSPKVQPLPLPTALTPPPVNTEQGPIVPPLEPSMLTIAPSSTPVAGSTAPVSGSTLPAGTPSGASGSASASAPAKRVVQKWTETEKADFLKFFSMHGKDWATLTDSIPTKTAAQIKNYYQNYKNRLGLQEILKRRIESSGGSSAATGPGAPSSMGMPSSVISPSDELQPAALAHMSLPSSSAMSLGGHDGTSSLHGSHAIPASMQNIVTQVDMTTPSLAMMQAHGASQQQSSRDVMGSASNSERYFKLLNMQHHLQMMHMQQQKPQGMVGESSGPGSPYHDGQMKTPGGSRLMQYSRHPSSHAMAQPQAHLHSAQQQLALQHSLHQAAAHGHPQGHPQGVHGGHPHTMQMQMQQTRGAYGEMPHPSMYHPMTQVHAHPHAVAAAAAAAQLGLASGAGRPYGLMDPSGAEISSARNDGSNPPANLMAGGANMLSQRDISSRTMLNLAMMNSATGSGGVMNTHSSQPNMKTSPVQQMAVQNADGARHDVSGHSTMYQLSPGMASRGSARTGEPGNPAVDLVKNEASGSGVQESQPMGYQGEGTDSQRRPIVSSPPKPTVRIPPSSRMSFSSILNDSNDSPRTVMTPRGAAQLGSSVSQIQHHQDSPHNVQHRPSGLPPPVPSDNLNQSPIGQSPTAHLLPRRGSSTASRMGLMSNLLNVASPEHRSPSHHSPMMQQQNVQSGRYYDVTGANQSSQHVEREGASSRVSIGAVLNSSSNHRDEDASKPAVLSHTTSAQAMGSDHLDRGFARNVSQQNILSSSDARQAGVSEAASSTSSGSVQTTSSSSNRGPTPPVPSPPHQQAQEMAWSYQHHMRYEEEAELLRRAAMEKERLARRAEEEAARAAAAAAAAARALQEAQQARQEAMDMAANVARFSSAIHQQHQLHHPQYQQQQLQSQHQQMQQQMQQQQQQIQQQQQQQQYSVQAQHHHHHQQQQQQQQEYQHHQQLQQQQQLQHQALHHHLQMMQQQHQHQQRATGIPPTLERDNSGGSHHHLMQQQQQHQQQQQQQPPGPSER